MLQKNYIEPKEVKSSPYYSNAIQVKGGKTLYISGQTAYDEQHSFKNLGDFQSQVERSLKNLDRVLKAAGAKPADIVSMRLYIKNYEEKVHLEPLMDQLDAFFPPNKMPTSTLIGVQSLALDNLLFEIEAVAVLPD